MLLMQFDVSGMGGAGTRGDTSLPAIITEAKLVESLGFTTLWGSDHLWDNVDIFKPQLERFTVIAHLAGITSKLRFGTLVTGNTYRHPAVLAKLVNGVDIISNGRIDFGIGTGWTKPEHIAYGIPLPAFSERVERLDEALSVIRMLWTQKTSTFIGRYYSLDSATFEPKNIQQPNVPITVGGVSDKLLKVAVARADEWSAGMGSPGFASERGDRLTELCDDAGRDPCELKRSFLISVKFIDDRKEADRYRAAYLEKQHALGAKGLTQKVNWIGKNESTDEGLLGMQLSGSKEEIAAGIDRFADLGFNRCIIMAENADDLKRFSAEVLPLFSEQTESQRKDR
jgi:alkanesulfonate monooxygenase SsuD/methylene tetrahydromethanopterin reductase-like flavin-dependent oxidoreductase (luciferase family)